MLTQANAVKTTALAGFLALLIPGTVAVTWAQQSPGEARKSDTKVADVADERKDSGGDEKQKFAERIAADDRYSWLKQKAEVDLAILRAQIAVKEAEIQKANAEHRIRELAPTQAILAKLEQPIPIKFPKNTPLEDVLKFIKSATAGPHDVGIPIYIDPVSLQDAGKTMQSPVTLDIEGVPLWTTLRLLLKQLGLAYQVKDGLLTICGECVEQGGAARGEGHRP